MSDKILIVDDEPNLLRMIEFTLQTEGYEVITAQSGKEGLEKVRTENPDLAILDVSMPDMTGIEVCQHLREDPETANLPVIMLSARSQTQDKINGLRAGSDEYVTKPVDPEEMIVRVEALLSRTRHLRQSGGQQAKNGKVIAFMGGKGGVGTTTVALNVAVALAKREMATAFVELRSYVGTAALQLGIAPERTLADVISLETSLINPQQLDMHLTTHASGLRVLCAPQKAEEFQDIAPEQAAAVTRGLAGMMDYTVLDLPSLPTACLPEALQNCHVLVLVIEPETTCLASAKTILELIQSWGGIPIRLLAVNRGTPTSSIAISEIKDQLRCEILGVMTPATELCAKALKANSPLIMSHPNSLATNSLLEMTDRLVEDQVMALS